MSSRTATPAAASGATSVITSVGAPLDEIAAIARRRAGTLNSDLGTDVLVQRTLERFDETFGTTSCPVDLDGWIRRAMREIADEAVHRPLPVNRSTVTLSRILEGLSAPVRSPALTKQRKQLLRRVSELIGGLECRVVIAMSTARSLDRVGTQLGLSSVDVARLHLRGLLRLQNPVGPRPRADAAADRRQPATTEGSDEPLTLGSRSDRHHRDSAQEPRPGFRFGQPYARWMPSASSPALRRATA